jgi:lon-related putative ATP-dependent protease
MTSNKTRLSKKDLREYCDPNIFHFETTEEVPPLVGTIGQERGVKAIEFALSIKTPGFNLYVAGLPGTGKNSTIRSYVQKFAETERVPSDWCYVYNFADPVRPIAISLPPGMGRVFAKDMDELIESCKVEIPRAFESEEYERRRSKILSKFQEEREVAFTEIQKDAKEKGFAVQLTTAGIVTIPLVRGKPISPEEFAELPEKAKSELQSKSEVLQSEIRDALKRIRNLEKEARNKVDELDKEIALFAIGHLLEDLKEKYKEYPKVVKHLDAVEQDIIEHLEDFKPTEQKSEISVPGLEFLQKPPIFNRYKVNVLVNNSQLKGAPMVVEPNPTYYNLFGKLEYKAEFGAMVTDFSMIKPGAIHRANGGYLILQALDLLLNPFSWEALKRTIRSREARIENIGEQYRAVPAATLRPEPIPVNLKVILIGNPFIYHLLYYLDEDFKRLFKVKADFDTQMERNKEHIDRYAAFISARCRGLGLRHFDKTAVAKVVEYGSWLAGDKKKLSTRFMEIADLISEASFWAAQNGNKHVTAKDVQNAIEAKTFRSNMIEEKIQELIKESVILIDTEGAIEGQINGLSVIDLGDYAFAKPSKITARVGLGKAGVINIEREAKMSGRIHNKGVMILAGYLNGKYAHDKPLTLSASLTFEQLYEEVEGDSASSAELYALLSCLAGVPLRQDLAVTGSVNQHGEIQPIGGVNWKIEGFFDICKARGLTGTQGVIIPRQNIKNLMLKEEVVKAVEEKKFHIYAISTIDEGIELLTGKEAGKRRPDGTYPEGTINYLVDKRLKELAEALKEYEVG